MNNPIEEIIRRWHPEPEAPDIGSDRDAGDFDNDEYEPEYEYKQAA